MPKLVLPEYRNNFFIAGGESIPAPPDAIYISNIRIAAGEADARRLLIKQLFEQGSAVTTDISFNPQTNEMTQQSYPVLDTLGKAMQADPGLNIQINGQDQQPAGFVQSTGTTDATNMATGGTTDALVKQKVEKMKAYLVQKFQLNVDRIVTGASNKIKVKTDALQTSQTGQKLKGFLTQFVKL
jgi:hypothetical protein